MGWLILVIIVVVVIYNLNKNKHTATTTPTDKEDNISKVGTDSEADKVYKEVERRKRRAEELGIKELISDLYFDKIKYYPHWLKNGPDYVCSLISSATELKEKKTDKQDRPVTETKITLKEKEYTFRFSEHSFDTPDGEWHTHGDLELVTDGKKVLALDVSRKDDEYGSEWSAFGVGAFIEGDWIKDFKDLKRQIEIDEKTREKKERESPQKINKLKEDFGIE